jgi:DNA-binding transcriptional regulator YdaS (Cro superfamily)
MGIEANIATPLAEAVRRAGSQSAFARIIGRSQTYVYQLLQSGRPLGAECVLLAEAGTGVSRFDLRPDLYQRNNAPPVSMVDASNGAPA